MLPIYNKTEVYPSARVPIVDILVQIQDKRAGFHVEKRKETIEGDGERFWERLMLVIGENKPFAWAKMVGIPKSTFSSCLAKKYILSGEHLVKIARKTGCPIGWLLTGEKNLAKFDSDIYSVARDMMALPEDTRKMTRDIVRRIAKEEKLKKA